MSELKPRSSTDLRVDQAFECPTCDTRWYYTRVRCPNCGEGDVRTYELGRGELVAVTEVHATPRDVRSPNRLGLARFGDVQAIAQLADDATAVGDRVAFAGAHRLRDGDDVSAPRLTRVPDS